jgi:methylenetetrahydrofolate--tRNA-(uracil-5-)-methyltransferase
MAGCFALAETQCATPLLPSVTTAMGALLNHITTGANADTFQPMNINFGLFPPLSAEEEADLGKKPDTRTKKRAMAVRALKDFEHWTTVYKKAS